MAHPYEVPVNKDYFLQSGYVVVPVQAADISTVLGSCVSVCLYDKKRRAGGMNHFKLPLAEEKEKSTALYGNVATVVLINMMVADGSKIKNLEAQIFGGAFNFEITSRNIGRENIEIARRVLKKKRIRIVSEDVGGQKGRKVVFNTHSGEVAVFKVDRLRKSDWYPYESER